MLCLEAVVVLKTELCDLCLAMRTCLPTYLRTLVATNVYVLCREELANLGEDILEELHCLLLSDAKNVVGDAPFAPYIVWTACTSELRVSCERSEHVTWKVNLRNHSDAFAGSIVKDFLYLLLSVIATFAIWNSVIDLAVEKMTYKSLLSD